MKKNKQQPKKQIYLQRVKCNCVAQKHELINNCLGCGKVVCAQQGEGPCLYCGNVVTRPDGQFIVNDEALFPTLDKQQMNKISQERSKAIVHKNILLERDKSMSSVSNIYDDNIDYYDASQNQWLDEESRQNAIDKLLAKDKFIQSQKYKATIMFDPLTGKFEHKEFSYDEESFREEGKNFVLQKQREQIAKKQTTFKSSLDQRMLKNEKVKEIVTELRQQLPKKPKNMPSLTTHLKLTEVIVEEQTTSTA